MATGAAFRCPACGLPARGDRYCRRCGNDPAAPAQLTALPARPVERTEYIPQVAPGAVQPASARHDDSAERTEYLPEVALDPPSPAGSGQRAPATPDGPPDPVGRPDRPGDEPHRRPPKGGKGSLVLLVALALLAGAGFGGYQVIRTRHDQSPSGSSPAAAASASAPVSQPTGRSSARQTAPTQTVTGQPANPSTTPTSSAGDPSAQTNPPVAVSPGLHARPETAEVTDLLRTYFGAVNAKDYPTFVSTQVDNGHVPTQAEFATGFASTQDTDVRLLGLDAVGTTATVSFVSHQDPALAPDHISPCLHWLVSYPLLPVNGTLRIGLVHKSDLSYQTC